ncbi:hypothetical protein JXB01_03680 [Candidatus Micrarchaeota archaeon]|nr:hypothetical protein [Candidatus Micrarchaeota archaeon]
MGKKRRGRDRPVVCISCGRSVPRTKAVAFEKRSRYSTDLKGKEEDITMFSSAEVYYCISCAKHRKITQKKKKMLERKRERGDREWMK